jgi:hypothetical protein
MDSKEYMKKLEKEKMMKHKEEIIRNVFNSDPVAFFEAALTTGYQKGLMHGALLVALISTIIIFIWK